MANLPTIGTLWIGAELSWLEELCLMSFVKHGHEVVLYSYDPVKNVPDGVTCSDAAEILPAKNIIRHARTGSPAYHADLFRLHMLHQTNYIWADTDAYCCQPWKARTGSHFHGWISDKKPQVNNGVLGLPKSSETLAEMLKFTSDEYPIPPWLSEKKQADLLALKTDGKGVHVSLLPWGVWGPDALTWFLKATGEIRHSFAGHVLYPVPFSIAGVVLNPSRRDKAAALIKDDTLSIHFWGRRFRNIAAKYGGVPSQGCYIERLLSDYNIDARKTAHMMQSSKPKTAPLLSPKNIDFSMFDTNDVANIILQRSEVGAVRQEIRDWVAGDDASILKYAEENRDNILSQAFEIARRECEFFIGASDNIEPKRVADIGCGYAFADLLLFQRYGCDLVLIDIEESSDRHFGFEGSGSGYTSLSKAQAFLEKNGVPSSKISLINPTISDVGDIGKVDLAISLASCGFHYPTTTYGNFFANQISSGGGIVLDVRKGSGGIGAMKLYGWVEVLAKHDKYSTVLAMNTGSKG